MGVTTVETGRRTVGAQLREWRLRRRLSQLDLSITAGISARHLSFVETGKSRPTAEMIVRLASSLDVPLRERNGLLLAGGFAPRYPQSDLRSAELAHVSAALRAVLDAHDPLPALVLDRRWDVLDHNEGAARLLALCPPPLREPPVNVVRCTLHPGGLAPHIANPAQWRGHLLDQLRARLDRTADPALAALLTEAEGYPSIGEAARYTPGVVLPMMVRIGDRTVSLFSMASTIETAADVTVDELVLETFYPADADTAAFFADLGVA